MRRGNHIGVLAMLCGLAAAAPAQRPVSLNVGGGVSLPQSGFTDGAKTGWHALVSLGLSTLMQPISLRLDASHHRFGASDPQPEHVVSSATLNLGYRLPMTNSPLSPYLIAGAGAYRSECDGAAGCPAATGFGWNAGLGTRFAALGFKGFVESRFHSASRGSGSTDIRFIPVSVALTF